MGLIPGQGAKIPRALQPKKQNIEQKQCCTKFIKDFKNDAYEKKKALKKSTLVIQPLYRAHYETETLPSTCISPSLVPTARQVPSVIQDTEDT